MPPRGRVTVERLREPSVQAWALSVAAAALAIVILLRFSRMFVDSNTVVFPSWLALACCLGALIVFVLGHRTPTGRPRLWGSLGVFTTVVATSVSLVSFPPGIDWVLSACSWAGPILIGLDAMAGLVRRQTSRTLSAAVLATAVVWLLGSVVPTPFFAWFDLAEAGALLGVAVAHAPVWGERSRDRPGATAVGTVGA